MADRVNRVLNLLIADTNVTAIVPVISMDTNHFRSLKQRKVTQPDAFGTWPVPGVLISTDGSPRDAQTHHQDLVFSTRCLDDTDVKAETLHQAVRLSLTGKSEFGTLLPVDFATQQALWRAQGITFIEEEVGGQSIPEPNSGQRGTEMVLATYKAVFDDVA